MWYTFICGYRDNAVYNAQSTAVSTRRIYLHLEGKCTIFLKQKQVGFWQVLLSYWSIWNLNTAIGPKEFDLESAIVLQFNKHTCSSLEVHSSLLHTLR